LFFDNLSIKLIARLKFFSVGVFLNVLTAWLAIFFLNLFITVLLRSFLSAFLADLIIGMAKT